MAKIVQKVIVHEDADASPLLPMDVALFNEDGTPFTGGGPAPSDATTSKAGVRKASNTAAVSSANATQAAGDAPTKAEFDAVVALLNDCKAQLNDHLSKVKTAGQMA